MARTQSLSGARSGARSYPIQTLSDTLLPLGDAVGTALVKKILIRRPLEANDIWQFVAATSPSPARRFAVSKRTYASCLQGAVKDLVIQVLGDSLAAPTDEGRRLRMSIIELLASQELVGQAKARTDNADRESGDALLTTADVASMLQVSRPYVSMLCDAGKLGEVTRTEGGHRRIRQSAVEAYLAERAGSLADAVSPRQAAVDAGLYARSDDEYVNQVRDQNRAARKSGTSRKRTSRGERK